MAQGVITILTAPDGRVVADAADFHRDRFGGCSQRESQAVRARKKLYWRVISNACADYIAKAMRDYDCQQIVETLTRDHGFTRSEIPIGYDEETEA